MPMCSEHAQAIRGDIMAMAFDLGRAKPMFDPDREQFPEILHCAGDGARPFRRDDHPMPTARPSSAPTSRWTRPSCCRRAKLLSQINETEPQIALIPEGDHVAAVVKLRGYDDMYLYVARLLDPRVVAQLRATQESVGEYANLEARRLGVQVAFALDVHGHRADRAAVGGLDRARFRQPAGRADPPPDRRRQRGLDRQSLRPGAGPPLRRRSRAARRDLQQDDAGTAHAARRHRARARPDRQPPPFHRSGAGRRQRRRHRRRRRRPHQHPQPLGRTADRRARSARRSASRSPRSCPSSPRFSSRRAIGNQRLVQGQVTISRSGRSAISRCASPASRPADPSTAMSSRSTTSPSSCWRSAPRPGPTSRAASPTRSRIR